MNIFLRGSKFRRPGRTTVQIVRRVRRVGSIYRVMPANTRQEIWYDANDLIPILTLRS